MTQVYRGLSLLLENSDGYRDAAKVTAIEYISTMDIKPMHEHTLKRYERHITLPQFGLKAHQKLSQKSALLLGIGGLGSTVSQFLVSAGLGKIILVDRDSVELSNLTRQLLYTTDDIGTTKVSAAESRLKAMNPEVNIQAMHDPDLNALEALCQNVDLLIDATDNFESRYTVNQWSLRYQKPLLSASAIGTNGQVILFEPNHQQPCYACLYPDNGDETSNRCVDQGVLSTVVGMIANTQAHMALMYLAEKNIEHGVLHCFNGETLSWKKIRVNQDKQCIACG